MSEEKGESNEAVGRGPRARRFSGNERNQANGTTRAAVPERAAFRTVRGTVPTTEQSLHRGTAYIASMYVIAVVGRGPRTRRKVDEQRGCRERFSTVPQGSPSTSSG